LKSLPDQWLNLVKENAATARAYLSLLSGSAGRLVISLAYFVAIANSLSIGDFGLFATASAVGIVLSRIAAFGFVSPLYRVATVKHRLLGTYTAGLLAGTLLSLPLVAAAVALAWLLIFRHGMAPTTFAILVLSEILFWRGFEIVIIVLNGLGRFTRGAVLLIIGTALRATAAVAFATFGTGALEEWALFYLTANAACLLVALLAFYPRVRLRWRPRLYLRRWIDAVSVAGAEVLFYLQSELDKMLVLAIGGPVTAGLYAMIMRLVDLTALPVRAAFTLLVQRLMRTPGMIAKARNRVGMETAVVAVSTAGIAAMAGFLWIFPRALGDNVAEAAPLLALVLAVPALRNLIEYHSELLYATGRTVTRTVNLALLAVAKAALLVAVLTVFVAPAGWATALNAAFLPLYALSAVLTYRALSRPAARPV
jgi:O-antigen/teichoic acid export membrane protein